MCRLGWVLTLLLVLMTTQTGTLLFCLVTLFSLFFLAVGLFLAIKTPPITGTY
jgi:hypothetical protein